MELQEIKEYLKLDDTYEDLTILSLQNSAEEYLSNAGVNKDYSKELYKLGIKILVSHWYDNRPVIGKADEMPYGLSSIITQLKYTQVEVTS